MVKVITYGSFDHLHQGHINLLKRAKALGDYLIVGVTTENFDISRGKINIEQSLMDRIEAVKKLGIADLIIPEEYEGQKIDDIKRFGVNIFTVGSDWVGKFDYLNEFCKVIYLERTKGISSTQIRNKKVLKIGVIGSINSMYKLVEESKYVNGVEVNDVYYDGEKPLASYPLFEVDSYDDLIERNDAIYIASKPENHYKNIMTALRNGCHVICDSPIALTEKEAMNAFEYAKKHNLVLFDSLKTSYILAYNRLISIAKSGIIGNIKALDATCTSQENLNFIRNNKYGTSFTLWGHYVVLPIIELFGKDYKKIEFNIFDDDNNDDIYTKAVFLFDNAIGTASVGIGVKSEGDLRISGTGGYIYVPSPWWKTEYFEVKFEDQSQNKKYFFKLNGEGLRTELVCFLHAVNYNKPNIYIDEELSIEISNIFEKFIKVLKNK